MFWYTNTLYIPEEVTMVRYTSTNQHVLLSCYSQAVKL